SLTSGSMRLEEMLGRRAARLPAEARRLLEVIAVGGRPLPLATVEAAAGVERSRTQIVAMLQARRFVRAGMRDGVETIEMIHDRVRETVVAQVPGEAVREYHAQLARVLESEPDTDPEALASHLLGAGDKERAARYAERAGEQALAKLAFAQAARLFRLTVETLDWPEADARRLYRRAAEASEWAGLAEDSARLYLAAADKAPGIERVDLERAAAAQLIAAGRIDEGTAVFRRVLAAVGRPVPASLLGVIFWVVVYRLASAIAGYRIDGGGGELSPEDRIRLDALSSATRGLTVIDPTSSMYVKARYLQDALRSGHRGHIVHAASAEASTMGSAGGQPSRRERALFELARRTAAEANDPEASALSQIIDGICLYLRGNWKDAVVELDTACERLAAARRWNANASVYAVYALVPLGDLREVRVRTARLLADAERHGDLYTAVNLRASHPIASWLAVDDVDGARRGLRDAMAHWPNVRFLVQHWQAMFWEAETALYAGDGAGAWERIERDTRALRRSFLLRVQLIRALTHYVVGCAAVASLASVPATERPGRLARAKKAAHKLARESMTWTAPLAAMVAAAAALAERDRKGAEAHLQRAATRAKDAQMPLHAAAATYRLAQLRGDSADTAAASEAMRGLGVRAPERYARMLLPDPSDPDLEATVSTERKPG
ncbi:MAG TPA: hypothetical protein VKU41_21195, partial [Polyangiaceae bacterium]|nr:hypothetical protein [Polyangiaceae bacterium]